MLKTFCYLLTGALIIAGCQSPDGPSPPKTAQEEFTTFQHPEDVELLLVASEPMVQDPVVITFDEDGRLWVVEMRGFMPDIDGNGETDPSGRISVLEDTNGDGQMDKSTIYIDSLVMPRAVAPFIGGALIVEDYSLWLTRDNNGDLIADSKELIDSTYAGTRLPEHSGNGLWRSLDNHYYNARSTFRYQLLNGKIIKDTVEFRGQWGISHDDDGRLFYNYNWSQLHADLVPPGFFERNKFHETSTGIDHGLTLDRRVFPIRSNPAVNRGYIPGTLDDDGKLREFTAACSPYVYRSHDLPEGYFGNAFVCDPSGNLVKRNVIDRNGVLLTAHDPDPGHEFLASTDERFRPVAISTGPDGALYVADMYRGLVQHGEYVTPYLRDQTIKRKLAAPIHYGRIWKVISAEHKPGHHEKLSALTSKQLVPFLAAPDGWYRDAAQRLIVERNDKTIADELKKLADGDNPLGRLHALWTMDGLNANDTDLLFYKMFDKDDGVSTSAMRILYKLALRDKSIATRLGDKIYPVTEQSERRILHIALIAPATNKAKEILYQVAERYCASPLLRDAVMSSASNLELDIIGHLTNLPSWSQPSEGRDILIETLAMATVRRSATNPRLLEQLLAIAEKNNSDSLNWKNQAILDGVAVTLRSLKTKPALTTVPAIMSAATLRKDPAVNRILDNIGASLLWPGHVPDTTANSTGIKLPADQQKLFASGRQQYLTGCAGCHGRNGEGQKRFAPPLAGSEWVTGDERRLALLVLHGLEGPIEVMGKKYDVPEIQPVMPSHSVLDDGAITSILVYIRNEWGNQAGPIDRRIVGKLRHSTQGRVVPWTPQELNAHMVKIDTVRKTN